MHQNLIERIFHSPERSEGAYYCWTEMLDEVAGLAVNHHRFFGLVRQSDWGLLSLNNLLLLLLSFVPFPTAFLGDHPSNAVAVALFSMVLMLAGLAFNRMWRHARRKKMVEGRVSHAMVDRAITRGLVGPIAYATAAIAAPLVIPLPWAISLLVPVFYAWPVSAAAGRSAQEKEPEE